MNLEAIDAVLTTTRAVRRRLDLDRPVDIELLLECLELAAQAPSGGSSEPWRWVVVTDPALRRRIADLYRGATSTVFAEAADSADSDASKHAYQGADYLAANLHRVPVLIIACSVRRASGTSDHELAGIYGSVIPAIWSLQLALRSRGLGSTYTTAHLRAADAIADLLGIPRSVTQVAMLPVAWTKGTEFRPAVRKPVGEVTFMNRWGHPTSS